MVVKIIPLLIIFSLFQASYLWSAENTDEKITYGKKTEDGTRIIYFKTGKIKITSPQVHLVLATAKDSISPKYFNEYILFAIKGSYHSIEIAFKDENFATRNAFEKNAHEVFVFARKVPLNYQGNLAYRLIIDGVWLADPNNTRNAIDSEIGLEVSLIDIPYLSDLHLGKYKIIQSDGRTAHFVFKADKNQIVSISGDFNNWNPFVHYLEETSPGIYELEINLPMGTNHYYFFYKGQFIADPLNKIKMRRSDGQEVSVLKVEEGLALNSDN